MIDDINNLFNTDRISSAFSGDALNALKDFNPINSFLFMTLFTLTVLWLISMIWGYCADKKFI
jgi:FtsH-binding integral membrane protein